MGKTLDLNGNILYEYEGELKGFFFKDKNLNLADFGDKDLSGAVFLRCYLRNASFRRANLREVQFVSCDLGGANIWEPDVYHTVFEDCYCIDTSFTCVNFKAVSFRECHFSGADFIACENHPKLPLACPSEGAFTGWKKVIDEKGHFSCLVELEIPADARRCSAASRKCRCDKAKVVSIKGLGGRIPDVITEVENSTFDVPLIYKVGEMVYPDSYDEDRWHECSHGIHFFINKQDAIDY